MILDIRRIATRETGRTRYRRTDRGARDLIRDTGRGARPNIQLCIAQEANSQLLLQHCTNAIWI